MRELLVFQRYFGTGSSQQRLCNEEAQSEPRHFSPAHAPSPLARHIRLPHAVDDFRRKARPVVVNHDDDFVVGPGRRNLDALAGEIHRILEDISEPVEHRGIAGPDRLIGVVLGDLDFDGDARPAMRRHDFLDQGGEFHPFERLAGGRQFGKLTENHPATLRLLAQQADILGKPGIGLDLTL